MLQSPLPFLLYSNQTPDSVLLIPLASISFLERSSLSVAQIAAVQPDLQEGQTKPLPPLVIL